MEAINLSELASNVGIVLLFLIFIWKTFNKFVEALDRLTSSNQRIADEAKERNGHLAQLVIENRQEATKSNHRIIQAVKNLKVQNVEQQNVENQTVGK